MAGMLPGVECARRRRFHQSGGMDSPSSSSNGCSRRPSFCLYTSNHDYHHTPCSSSQRSALKQTYQDEKLGGAAREAKERLDERLRAQRKSESKRSSNGQESPRIVYGRSVVKGELQIEVYGSKKGSGSKRFSWPKLGWKASDQDECAICLEQFKVGQTLVHLPCAHRFHSSCLCPWLQSRAHCPCCRTGILT